MNGLKVGRLYRFQPVKQDEGTPDLQPGYIVRLIKLTGRFADVADPMRKVAIDGGLRYKPLMLGKVRTDSLVKP